MHYTAVLSAVKFGKKKHFPYFCSKQFNIDYGYTLEPTCQGSANEYPQSMFWIKNKKIRYTPVNPSFTLKKWGKGGIHSTDLLF